MLLIAQKRALEMVARGESLTAILEELCDAIDAQSPGIISFVMLVDPDGNVTTRPQLLAYWVVMQYAAELARSESENPSADGLRTLLRA